MQHPHPHGLHDVLPAHAQQNMRAPSMRGVLKMSVQRPVCGEGLPAKQLDIAGHGSLLMQILLEGRTKVICFEAAQEDTIKVGSWPLCPSMQDEEQSSMLQANADMPGHTSSQ